MQYLQFSFLFFYFLLHSSYLGQALGLALCRLCFKRNGNLLHDWLNLLSVSVLCRNLLLVRLFRHPVENKRIYLAFQTDSISSFAHNGNIVLKFLKITFQLHLGDVSFRLVVMTHVQPSFPLKVRRENIFDAIICIFAIVPM